MSFIKHAHGCDVTADVAIRVDALEDLLNEWNATLSKAERKQTHSMGAELGNISEGRASAWPPSPARIGSRRREMRRGCRIQNDESRREERP